MGTHWVMWGHDGDTGHRDRVGTRWVTWDMGTVWGHGGDRMGTHGDALGDMGTQGQCGDMLGDTWGQPEDTLGDMGTWWGQPGDTGTA